MRLDAHAFHHVHVRHVAEFAVLEVVSKKGGCFFVLVLVGRGGGFKVPVLVF
jgi:hypothetical protein